MPKIIFGTTSSVLEISVFYFAEQVSSLDDA